MSIPLPVLAKQLAIAEGYEFQNILKQLRSSNYINEKILKSDLALLVTKIQKLLKSSDDFDIWKGCHTTVVICTFNPLVLGSHGGQLLNLIYTQLEKKVTYYSNTVSSNQGRILLETLVFTLSKLMDLLRDKPTLSRESLVPKLKAIIPTLISLAECDPKTALPLLKKLLLKNTTTFKPYVNKLRAVLSNMLSKKYQFFNKETQRLICDTFAYLHLIKINAPQNVDESSAHHKALEDETWRIGLNSVLYEFQPLVKMCNDIVDFEQDKTLKNLIFQLLPKPNDSFKSVTKDILPSLSLDLNTPLSLWELPNRLHLLADLLTSFISLPTPYPVRIPIGSINLACEALLGITCNYLPLKRELRSDAELLGVINDILPEMQFVGIKIWKNCSTVLDKLFVSNCDSILASLELFIPLIKKTNKIDFNKCLVLKEKFLVLLELTNILLKNIGHSVRELNFIKKLVDVSIHLTEPISLTANLFINKDNLKTSAKNNNNNNNNKKQKKDNLGTLSDLYTHSNAFLMKSSIELYDQINNFLCAILSTQFLPSSQQIKVIKYAVTMSLKFKNINYSIPSSFVNLLRYVVLFPSKERVSILPIAISILKETGDDVFDTMCHSKLPFSAIHQVTELAKSSLEEQEIEDNQDDEMIDVYDLEHSSGTTNEEENKKVTEDVKAEEKIEKDDTKKNNLPAVEAHSDPDFDSSKIMRKRSIGEVVNESENNAPIFNKQSKTTSHEDTTSSTTMPTLTAQSAPVAVVENDEDDSDSDFVIPEIELSDEEEE